jgi:hypothetical protein
MNLATVLALTVIWAGATGIRGFIPDLREVVAYARTGETPPKCTPRPLAGTVRPGNTRPAEDPSIPVLLRQTPIVLDALMVRRLDELQPQASDGLVTRIERGEFDRVALVMPVADEDYLWEYYHLVIGSSGRCDTPTFLLVRSTAATLPVAPLVMSELVR